MISVRVYGHSPSRTNPPAGSTASVGSVLASGPLLHSLARGDCQRFDLLRHWVGPSCGVCPGRALGSSKANEAGPVAFGHCIGPLMRSRKRRPWAACRVRDFLGRALLRGQEARD